MGRMKILHDGFPCLKPLSLKDITFLRVWRVQRIFPNISSYHMHKLEVLTCQRQRKKVELERWVEQEDDDSSFFIGK
ncbi:hypothetical protein AAHA92_12958 [Salvia divinorum]|uniref:Uncharacterized protein n=1 Tax=Salvia divinorum TaxID=28513 RepID=A0ABD1H6T4_SALDI